MPEVDSFSTRMPCIAHVQPSTVHDEAWQHTYITEVQLKPSTAGHVTISPDKFSQRIKSAMPVLFTLIHNVITVRIDMLAKICASILGSSQSPTAWGYLGLMAHLFDEKRLEHEEADLQFVLCLTTLKRPEVQNFVLKFMTTTLQQYLGVSALPVTSLNKLSEATSYLHQRGEISAFITVCIFITSDVKERLTANYIARCLVLSMYGINRHANHVILRKREEKGCKKGRKKGVQSGGFTVALFLALFALTLLLYLVNFIAKRFISSLLDPFYTTELKRGKKPGEKRKEWEKGRKKGAKKGGKRATVNDPNMFFRKIMRVRHRTSVSIRARD
ncbi:hypothetical protein B0H16DRAFT_1699590 [Mycena metata]|uniref:Uncharacterized protein n=1 Tax=Mycena metata TaxID=1033252 RepID=A0AAD7MKR3_9AGAR|nr:hypothetical protein B0H16DRAFT_1699590 [Mycena metata]